MYIHISIIDNEPNKTHHTYIIFHHKVNSTFNLPASCCSSSMPLRKGFNEPPSIRISLISIEHASVLFLSFARKNGFTDSTADALVRELARVNLKIYYYGAPYHYKDSMHESLIY